MQVQKKLLKFSACLGETDTRENERSTALRGLRKAKLNDFITTAETKELEAKARKKQMCQASEARR